MKPRMSTVSFLAAALTALCLAACGKAPPEPAAEPAADPNVVAPASALFAQLKVAPVDTRPLGDTLRVAGRLDFDEGRIARIGAPVTGRVTELHATVGQPVRPGDVLAELNSTELSAAQLAYLKATSQAELQGRAVDRAKQLFAADVIGAAELQRRENELGVALAEQRAAKDQLRIFGLSSEAIDRLGKQGTIRSLSPVVSTLAGTVVDRKVAIGQVVQPADALFTVADLSRLWAIAQVPEQQADLVRPGQAVTIEIPALGGEKLTGKLIHVGETVDPETRTVLVRTELDNKDRRLKPAMLATMLIAARPVDRLVVPATAVVREDNADRVFVDIGDGRFRLTPVTLGPEQEGMRAVLAGLAAGQRIVADGAFHLNNERKRRELE